MLAEPLSRCEFETSDLLVKVDMTLPADVNAISPVVGKVMEVVTQMQPLSMALLARLTPRDVEVRFYDGRMEEIPFDEPTNLVASSVETFTALRGDEIARQFRARGVPVVGGG